MIDMEDNEDERYTLSGGLENRIQHKEILKT